MSDETLTILAEAFLVFFLRSASMTLSSLRMLFVARRIEMWAAAVGAIESLAFVVALGVVAATISNLPNLLANSFGFAAGTVLGMRLEQMAAAGYVTVRVFTSRRAAEIAASLREHGFGVTAIEGQGRVGPVDVLISIVGRSRANRVIQLAEAIDSECFVSWDETESVGSSRGRLLGG